MALFISRLNKAEEALKGQGLSEEQIQLSIVDSISRNMPDYEEKITSARDSGASNKQILESFRKNLGRTTDQDVLLQIPVGLSRVLGAPRAVGGALEAVGEAITDPKKVGKNLIRSLFGQEPDTAEEPSIAEQFLGKDRAQSLKEMSVPFSKGLLSFQGLEDLIGTAKDRLLKGPFGGDQEFEVEGKKYPIHAPGFDKLLFEGPTGTEIVDGLSDMTGIDLQAQTPAGRVTQGVVGTFAETAPSFGAGAGVALARGEGVKETLKELGVPEGLSSALGVGATFFKVKPNPSELDIKRNQRAFTAKNIKKMDKSFNPLEKGTESGEFELNPTRVRRTGEKLDLGEVNTRTLSQRVARNVQEPLLDSIALDIGTPEEALGTVQTAIQGEFDAARATTSNAYNQVKFELKDQNINMTGTRDAMIELGERITEFGLTPEGQTAFRGFLNDQLELLGDGLVPAERAIQAKQNFNAFLDFQFPDMKAKTQAKTLLNGARRTAVKNLNNGIRRVNREVFPLWREAELRHGQNAERFGKKSVVRLQRAESPLKARSSLKEADELGHLKTAVGAGEGADILDRLALEEINLASATEETERVFSDIRRRLSPNAQEVGDSILEVQDPRSLRGRSKVIQQQIVSDIAESQALGTYPKSTIDMMVTREGHDLVRRTLNLTPEGRQVIPIVERAFVQDLFSSFEKDGVINSKELNKFLDNPELTAVYERIEGRQALNNLRNLSERRGAIENIFRDKPTVRVPKAKKLPPGLLDFVGENQGKFKFALGLMKAAGIGTFRFAKYASGVNYIAKVLPRLLKNPKIMANLRGIELRPGSAKTFLIELNKEVERELKKESKG